MQRAPDVAGLPSHPDPFHQTPGRLVGGEAIGRYPAQRQAIEAEPQHLPDRLGRETMPTGVGMERPAEIRLNATSLVGDLCLCLRITCPGFTDRDHQVADDLAFALDDQ